MTAAAALAAVVLESAALVASAMADHHRPAAVHFAYTSSSVIVTATTTAQLDAAFPLLHAAFTAAGWGFTTGYGPDGDTRSRISFQPPWTLTLTGAPAVPYLPN